MLSEELFAVPVAAIVTEDPQLGVFFFWSLYLVYRCIYVGQQMAFSSPRTLLLSNQYFFLPRRVANSRRWALLFSGTLHIITRQPRSGGFQLPGAISRLGLLTHLGYKPHGWAESQGVGRKPTSENSFPMIRISYDIHTRPPSLFGLDGAYNNGRQVITQMRIDPG